MMKYKKYKTSGVEWLDDIPEHWSVMRTTNYCIQNKKDNIELKETNLLSLSYGRIIRKDIDTSFGLLPASFSGYQIVDNGYLIFRLTDLQNDKRSLRVGFCNEKGIITSAYLGLIFDKRMDRKFSFYLFYSYDIKKVFYSQGGSMRQSMKFDDFKTIPMIIPPIDEQTAISQYLDTKTQAIDKKIKLLTKKADYYKELRKSIINDAVCKGLDKNVKLKESGIDWIGKIPEHWKVERLKALGEIETSSVNKKIEEDEELVKLVNYTDVYGNMNKEIWNSDSYMVVSANKLQLRYKRLRQGDVLFTPSSETIADIGVSAVVMEDLNNTLYSYHILRLKFSLKMQLNFKKYLFNNDFVQEYFSKSATGTTRKILGLNTFYNLLVVFPPTIDEQTAIANYLDEKTHKIDAIVSNIGKQIDTLKELCKTLINDVVTGKIKVTNN